MDFLKGELIEIIEWTDDSRDTLSYRFPDDDKAIKNGAQLIVRESQQVQFVYLGEFGDTFGPGKHTLTTDNIPILTRLKSWKYGLQSPFKADVYYLNTRLFTGNKWGTANPIMMRDDDLGIVRARAFGTYDFRIMDFLKGELLEIIEWTDDSRDTLSYRFPDDDKAIKRGAQLIVRESQVAQFVYVGEFGDTFGPGKHTLTTDNIPILTRLQSWKYGLESPFKADVYFLTTRLFTGNKWGTANPIMMRDADFGIVRARAFGTFDFKIVDPKLFLKEVAGSDQNFRLDEFADTMRSRIVSVFSDALASAQVPVLDVATRYGELGEALLPLINPVVGAKYGLQIASFIIENVSVPPEVEAAIDKRSSMAAVGNLNDFVKYQMAKGMEAPGGGGAAGTASQLAVGFAIAQQLMQQSGVVGSPTPAAGAAGTLGVAVAPTPARSATGMPDLLSPAEAAQALGVSEEDVMAIITSGELQAKKIGASYRIRRAALQEYLEK